MSQVFASQLGLKIRKTNVRARKIDDTTLVTYKMIISIFFMSDKDVKKKLFEESFLLAEINPDIMLGILFLIINNVDVDFQAWNL